MHGKTFELNGLNGRGGATDPTDVIEAPGDTAVEQQAAAVGGVDAPAEPVVLADYTRTRRAPEDAPTPVIESAEPAAPATPEDDVTVDVIELPDAPAADGPNPLDADDSSFPRA